MRNRLVHQAHTQRTFVLVFEKGERVAGPLLEFCRTHRIHAAHFTGIGAFEQVALGYFNWERKDYDRIDLTEQVEVLSFLGDIGIADNRPALHAHVVVGKSDATAFGGHLIDGVVRPTLEIVLTDAPSYLQRERDPETGLALLRP